MNIQRIEILLAKYEQGLTSLKEEHELRAFFQREDVPLHLLAQKKYFVFLDEAAMEEPADPGFEDRILAAIAKTEKPQSRGRVRRLIVVGSMAASLALLIGFGLFYQPEKQFEDTYENPELAYLEARDALMKVSKGLNAGEEEISKVEMFSIGLRELESISTFKKGVETLEKIGVINKNTNTKNEQ